MCHNMPSTSWRTKRTGSVTHSNSKGLRTRSSKGQGQEKTDVQAPQEERVGTGPSFAFFVLFGPATAWRMPAHISEGRSLLRSTESEANLLETPSLTHPEVMLYQLPGHP